MEKVRPWCGQPLDRGQLNIRTEQSSHVQICQSVDLWKMAAIGHLGFIWRTAVCPRELILVLCARAFGGLHHCAKFAWHRCSTFDNMKVLIICTFGLTSPIHAPKNSGFWEFDPINGQHYQQHPKKHILPGKHVT